MDSTKKQEKMWINCIKALAILGVVLQHVSGYVYTNPVIGERMAWAVALFLFVGGYNAMQSYRRRGSFSLWKRLSGLALPYALAVFLYVLYARRTLDFSMYVQSLTHFSVSGPHYYMAVILQLVIITPILIMAVEFCSRKRPAISYPVLTVLIVVIAYLSTKYTQILDIDKGGGKIFGGPWLIVWYLGIVSDKWPASRTDRKQGIYVLTAHTFLLLAMEVAGIGLHLNRRMPPVLGYERLRGFTWLTLAEAILLFYWIKEWASLAESTRPGRAVLKPLNCMGRYTLYIFLYHLLFLSVYSNLMVRIGLYDSWIGVALCLPVIVIGPMVFGWCIRLVKKKLVGVFHQ